LQRCRIIGIVLDNFDPGIEGHEQSFIPARAKHRVKKSRCRLTLETKFLPHTSARIDEQRDVQGQIPISAEIGDRLRLAIFENCEVVLCQIRDELAAASSHCEQDVHPIHTYRECLFHTRNIEGLLPTRTEGECQQGICEETQQNQLQSHTCMAANG